MVICTTSSVLKENKSVFDRGMDSLLMYIDRNATWELQCMMRVLTMLIVTSHTFGVMSTQML